MERKVIFMVKKCLYINRHTSLSPYFLAFVNNSYIFYSIEVMFKEFPVWIYSSVMRINDFERINYLCTRTLFCLYSGVLLEGVCLPCLSKPI